jgi:hypothetical protein
MTPLQKEALQELKKMWIWLYQHPAHDKKYYVEHVVKAEPPWKNDCPLCAIAEDNCKECLLLWDNGHGSLCSDPASPLSKWKETHLNNPDYRTWYAGQMIDITQNALK